LNEEIYGGVENNVLNNHQKFPKSMEKK